MPFAGTLRNSDARGLPAGQISRGDGAKSAIARRATTKAPNFRHVTALWGSFFLAWFFLNEKNAQ
jgi:hypothetical protein